MKEKISGILILPILLILFSSCSVIESIFKAGTGIVVFFVVIALTVVAFALNKIIERYKILILRSGNFNF